MTLSFVVVSFLGLATPERSLWGLTSDADVVVVARVVEAGRVPHAFDAPHDTEATLEVSAVLKGNAEKQLTVGYIGGWICPPPPKFIVGATVVAFLTRADGYEAPGWDAARPSATDAELKQLQAMVVLAVHAQRVGSPSARHQWAVEAFKHRTTRADGLSELGEERHGILRFELNSASSLSDIERSAMENAFVAEPSFNKELAHVLWLFNGNPSSRLTSTVADVMETVFATTQRPDWLFDALSLLEARLQKHAFDPSLLEDAHIDPWLAREQGMRNIDKRWAALKKQYKLEPVRREMPL